MLTECSQNGLLMLSLIPPYLNLSSGLSFIALMFLKKDTFNIASPGLKLMTKKSIHNYHQEVTLQ